MQAQRAEGQAEGRAEGKRAALQHLVRRRFGEVAALERRLAEADEGDLDALLDRLLTATGPEDL